MCLLFCYFFFFFNDTATTEIYTLSLHDALPISGPIGGVRSARTLRWRLSWAWASARSTRGACRFRRRASSSQRVDCSARSEEHTSELQSRQYLVCRLLLEKKKKT